ncbi:hypothetical protein OBBRIDRAFT_795787 [Obba rivulosa]|uniref:CUE domain-containing protein n=1 Tax=Obba rivulosa TaxID=1052685 RepID=A0A8E2AR92_9APHY|nr:hypothetical protein OBBRIDRAFT_795787 [Obba rivulosa]
MDLASDDLPTYQPRAATQADTPSPEHRDAEPETRDSTAHIEPEPERQQMQDDEETPVLPPRPESEDESEPIAVHMEYPTATETHLQGGEQQEQEELHPQVAALRAMFPDFDAGLLISVLESVGGDQDRAVDVLLGMSDPDYVSTQGPVTSQAPDLELDEQLARQLALEDQQQQQQRQHATGQQWPRRDRADAERDVPYQTRQRAPPHAGPQGEGGQATGGERGEFQETVSRLAESGKRTFSSIVSKVKAKISEYDQGRGPNQSSAASTTPQWGSAPVAQFDRHSATQAYTSEHYGDRSQAPPIARGPAQPQAPARRPSLQGYDIDEDAHQIALGTPLASANVPSTPPNSAAVTNPPTVSSATTSPRLSGDVSRPPPASSPINAAKIGLLPKRPVSLMGSQVSPTPLRAEDDDELEYTENPFEEGSK